MVLVAAQAIDTWEIDIGSLDRLFLPSDADGFFAAVIGLHVDFIMLTDAVLFLFQAAYPFPYFICAFFSAGTLQSGV